MRARLLPLALLTMLVAAACDQASSGQPAAPSPTPSSSPPSPAAGLPQPPPGPIVAGDDTAAARALAAAGVRTSQAGSLRLRLVAHVGAPGATRHLDVNATGEAESSARSSVNVVVDVSGRTISTQSVTYDGRSYSRTEDGPWKPVAPGATSDPRRYLNFVSGAHGVVDVGPGQRGGRPAEEYRAAANNPGGTGQGGAPATPAVSAVGVTAWVDAAGGWLSALDLVFPDLGAGTGTMTLDFSDFGAPIHVVPPAVASP